MVCTGMFYLLNWDFKGGSSLVSGFDPLSGVFGVRGCDRGGRLLLCGCHQRLFLEQEPRWAAERLCWVRASEVQIAMWNKGKWFCS